ncbi:MAG: nucleotide sugar dehydrogenase [Actinomycetota bacterium]
MSDALAVFGLGYVGAVSAACFASRGRRVVGVDVNPDKVAMVNSGQTPVLEEDIGELIDSVVADGSLSATSDVRSAVAETDLALVCVGTPSGRGGGLETTYLERVAAQIGEAINELDRPYTVVVRSTMVPGTSRSVVIPNLEKGAQREVGDRLGYAVNPEFLREGSSVKDFHNPPKTVIGQSDDATGDIVAGLYDGLPGPVFRVDLSVAEMVKYADNSFHALKVAFANEIGTISKALGLDSHEVMDVFKSDTKLNISPAYLTPGFAFGGSCLPKDVRALNHTARHLDVELPLVDSLIEANEAVIDRVFDEIVATGAKRVGLFGLSFKPGTDDLRESPLVALAERCHGRGLELLIWDDQVQLSAIQGANRAFIDSRIPHLSKLLVSSAESVARHAEVVVLGTKRADAVDAAAGSDAAHIVDLVRVDNPSITDRDGYSGVAW